MDVRVGLKKAEHRRIDAFELWCWRRLLRVPFTARRSNQSILKEISPGCSLEGIMLKLKLQYLGHLIWRVDSLEKTDAGRDWGQEEKGTTEEEMAVWHHQLDGHEFEWTPGDGDGQGGLAWCNSWGRKESDTTEWLNWTELKLCGSQLQEATTFVTNETSNVSIGFNHSLILKRYTCWAYTLRKPEGKGTHVPQCSLQHCL